MMEISSSFMKKRFDSRVAGYILLFIFAHFSHHVLTALVVPMLPFMRNEFALSYFRIGLLSAFFTVSYGLGQLPAGWISDRIGPRFVITVGVAGAAAMGALVGLSETYLTLALFLILMGIAGGGYHPAASPLIAGSVAARARGRALGMHAVGGSLSHFLAPIIGAALAAALGWRGAFLSLSMPVFAVGMLLLVLLAPRRGSGEAAAAGTAREETADGIDAADPSGGAGNRTFTVRLVTVLILTGTLGAFVQGVIAFVPLLMVDRYGLAEESAAAFLSLAYSAGFWAAPIGGYLSDRFGHVKVLFFLGLLLIPAVAFMPFVPPGVPLVVLLLSQGIVMFVRMPASEAFLVGHSPARMRSTVLGIYFAAGMGGSGLLTPVLGSLIDGFGFAVTFLSAGAVLAAIVLGCSLVLAGNRVRLQARRV